MATPAPVARKRPSIARLFLTFAKIGLLAFGGGSSSLVLIQQECSDRGGWITEDEFTFTLALSRMYPGIHIVAQAVLIGYMVRGYAGALAASLGMLVPSSTVAIVLTMFFLQVAGNPVGHAVLDGLLPATAGLTLGVALKLTRKEVEREDTTAGLASLAIIGGSFLLVSVLKLNSALIVIGAGLAGVVLFRVLGGTRGPA